MLALVISSAGPSPASSWQPGGEQRGSQKSLCSDLLPPLVTGFSLLPLTDKAPEVVVIAAVSNFSTVNHCSVFCSLDSVLLLPCGGCSPRPWTLLLPSSELKDFTRGSRSSLTSWQHSVVIRLPVSEILSSLTGPIFSSPLIESASCWGFEHHYHHTLSISRIRLCIQQVLWKDVLKEPCLLPSPTFAPAPILLQNSANWLPLHAQALPSFPSQCRHRHTPFPHAVIDVLAPMLFPLLPQLQCCIEAIEWMASQQFGGRASLNYLPPLSQQPLHFPGIFDC